ncbi:hypothetical protein A7A78_13160 [Aequorivita soesokkakensis]|uniref:Uracil-DNA glycosylase-like domain-containing protein n=1 Tax=Aequorivita soesokkakensis TaxID=1385699 RepID=A0A1A9LCU8_9FLAO|nr:hypothetical protein [Aequorivita soesokkakensis]OAD90897.1 hypothetical protein A7A78_13160 [Aequorivita soesokkakensis]
MQNERFKNWEKDVLKGLEAQKKIIDQNEQAQHLYGGFYIWDSKYILNPEIMFIGINPGNGNPSNNGSLNYKPESQMSYLEFLDTEEPNLTYTLARETIDVFKKSGYNLEQIIDILNNKSVKTNFHYIITRNETDIKKCFNLVEQNGFNNYWLQSYKWTGDLINIIRPKVIICEGKGVFDVIKDYEDYTDLEWEDNCGFLKREDGIVVLGYSRTFSNIKNKTRLAELIKKHIII